jgi:hypothetical protein
MEIRRTDRDEQLRSQKAKSNDEVSRHPKT